jgi:hypothetical protein
VAASALIYPRMESSQLMDTFVHNSKLSRFIEQELKSNGLLIESLSDLAPEKFMVVQQDASNAILAGLASRIALRLGLDAITDQPISFAVGALRGVAQPTSDSGVAEGALLAAIASIMIPASAGVIPIREYQEIRESYSGIRGAFAALTTELASQHRLGRVSDSTEFEARIKTVAHEFDQQYRDYRKSRYAQRFKNWTPLCVGGVLSVAGAFVSPHVAAAIAATSFVIQVIEENLRGNDVASEQRVFHMLAGLRRDVIKRSGIRELV